MARQSNEDGLVRFRDISDDALLLLRGGLRIQRRGDIWTVIDIYGVIRG